MKSNGADILVVDDEADIRDLVAGLLEDEGHSIRTASNSDEALAAIRARKPSLALLDIWMQGGGIDGLELLDIIRTIDPDLPVVMISGHGNIETAVSALQRGAYDFIEKPFKSDRLVVVIQRALEAASLKRENRQLRAQAMTPTGIIGKSAAAVALRNTISKVAPANSRVLISGPPGSGKELVARQIHEASPRGRSEFVAIAAAGMTPERLDLELFGEEGVDGRPSKIVCSSAPTTAPSTSTRSPTCRARVRAASCACWSNSASAASAASRTCRSMCASSPPPRAT